VVVEGERVPGEPPARPRRCGHGLEEAAAVGPGGQVQQRAERAVDQRRLLVEVRVAHVGLDQVEFHARVGGAGAGLRQHRGRRVQADHPLSRRPRDRDRDTPVPDREFDQRFVLTGHGRS
jgi:hypothetical protein